MWIFTPFTDKKTIFNSQKFEFKLALNSWGLYVPPSEIYLHIIFKPFHDSAKKNK